MPRLKNRQLSIPGGLSFYLPEIKWRSRPNSSFDTIARELFRAIQSNPAQAAKNQWPTDIRGVEEWVDLYNATVCAKMGWVKYIQEEGMGSVPKATAPHQQATLASLRNAAVLAKELVAGAKTLMEWDESGEPPVTPEKALARAQVCCQCPLNDPSSLTSWFTVPAAELIQRRVERFQARKLTTPRDEYLHLCTACHCPLKLKVHIPIDWITKRLSNEQKERLKAGRNCWIIAEAGP